jgi:hypothetical protein
VRPILIAVQVASGGRLGYVFSLTPGRRVTIVGPDTGDPEAVAADIAAAVLPVLQRTLAQKVSTP